MPRRLIICADGTWNEPEKIEHTTNVLKLARAVRPRDPEGIHQVVFYDWGVGTQHGSDRVVGGAFGTGLNKNIRDAYRFLVHNYAPGDQLFFLGFSRGAYTVRSLAGMIRNCGLLKKRKSHLIEAAFEHYRSPETRLHPDSATSRKFRRAHSRKVPIHFLGVFDTVGALGVPLKLFKRFNARRHGFHDARLSSWVKNAHQALAIDEKRKPFKPSIWSTEPGRKNTSQVWFAGVHTNIGGGYPFTGLSNKTLLWMVDRARESGLCLDTGYLKSLTPVNAAQTLGKSYKKFYRLLGPAPRRIGTTNPHDESIHPSALRRFEEDPSYRPPNLSRFLTAQER
jgi:uncharacterized protein (DUF2235 family)